MAEQHFANNGNIQVMRRRVEAPGLSAALSSRNLTALEVAGRASPALGKSKLIQFGEGEKCGALGRRAASVSGEPAGSFS